MLLVPSILISGVKQKQAMLDLATPHSHPQGKSPSNWLKASANFKGEGASPSSSSNLPVGLQCPFIRKIQGILPSFPNSSECSLAFYLERIKAQEHTKSWQAGKNLEMVNPDVTRGLQFRLLLQTNHVTDLADMLPGLPDYFPLRSLRQIMYLGSISACLDQRSPISQCDLPLLRLLVRNCPLLLSHSSCSIHPLIALLWIYLNLIIRVVIKSS